jgi:hypothetical protein
MTFKHTSLERLLDEPVDLAGLISGIDFEDEEILNASKVQGDLFLQASRLYIQKMRSRTMREARLKELTSIHSLRIRERLQENGGRVTEGHVTAKLDRRPTIKKAKQRLERAKLHEEFCKLLLEAFRMRRDVLKIVGNLIGAEVYIAREATGHSSLEKVKRKLEKRYRQDSVN